MPDQSTADFYFFGHSTVTTKACMNKTPEVQNNLDFDSIQHSRARNLSKLKTLTQDELNFQCFFSLCLKSWTVTNVLHNSMILSNTLPKKCTHDSTNLNRELPKQYHKKIKIIDQWQKFIRMQETWVSKEYRMVLRKKMWFLYRKRIHLKKSKLNASMLAPR